MPVAAAAAAAAAAAVTLTPSQKFSSGYYFSLLPASSRLQRV